MKETETIKPVLKSRLQRWKKSLVNKAAEWSPRSDVARGVRSPHFWIITALIAFGTLNYYMDQTPLVNMSPFNQSFFTSVHDLHRTLFFIPVIYAALVFRVWGSLIASFAFLCVVLPRALLLSPYPDPLLRPVLFVIFATLISLLIATQLNRIEKERKARTELSTAYQELSQYHQRLKESQEQLIQAEKLTSLGQMAASIAHEVNNPLAGVLVYTQLLSKKITSDNISKEIALDYLSKMESELIRSTKLVRNLLDFARQSPPTLREVDINDVVNRAFDLVAHSAELQHIQVIKELSPSLPKPMADFDQLQQVCSNLILNAIQAMPEGGRLTLRTSADNGQLKIEVQDTGCGISPENMRKLFTPFFTTKGEGKGVGLGLAVAYGIIQRHQGRIEVQSKEAEGTTFTIFIPLHHEEQEES
ncbi:MAG: ATP-binding protein [Dehalococcoidia bacterium]|nr:ATP-binding protein [Dehalococcoidia bacterium]